MTKFKCRCDNVIDLSVSPAPQEKHFIGEDVIESLAERVSDGSISSDELFLLVDTEGQDALLCEMCGRIWIYNAVSCVYNSYVREIE